MKTFIILGWLLLAGQMVNAQIMDEGRLDSLFLILDAKQKTMGSIQITQAGQPIYAHSIGYSSLEAQKKATQHTRYRVGSITKVFTATLIFQLVDEGKLSLETPLANFFPQITNAEKISIGSLLNHSSGLYNLTDSQEFNPYQPTTPQLTLATITGFKPVFEPDTKSEYSNTNYILLGYILEKIVGKPYALILKERITDKLSLENTYYGGAINTQKNEAYSYQFTDGWEKARETDMSLPHGAGAIVSNPHDLNVFIHALFNNKLLSKQSFAKMTSQRYNTGYGIMKISDNGIVLYGHDGGIDGFESLLIYVPEKELAIAFTANANQYLKQLIIKSSLMASLGMRFEMPTFEEIAVCAEELEQYTGVYTSKDAPMALTFIHKDGKLLGAATGQAPYELKATKKHQFKLEQEGITLHFNPEMNSLRYSQGGMDILFIKEK